VLADLHDGGMIMWIGSDIIMTVLAVAVAAAVIHGRRQAGQLGRWVEGIRRTALLRALDTTGVPAPAASRAGPDARAIDDDAHLAAYNAYLSALDTGPPGPRQGP
jgi:putative copper resistance protein D